MQQLNWQAFHSLHLNPSLSLSYLLLSINNLPYHRTTITKFCPNKCEDTESIPTLLSIGYGKENIVYQQELGLGWWPQL